MNNFATALGAIERLKKEGVVKDYAIGGAMALVFWSEPIPTFDIDVFVVLGSESNLVSLTPIAGMPVQMIPAHSKLAEEAVASAAQLDFEGQPVRVIRPEHLIALYLEPSARTHKRLERVAALLEEGQVDRELLDTVLRRYNLRLPKYE